MIDELIERQTAASVCPVCGETSPGAQWVCLYQLNAAARESVRQAGRCDYSLEGSERIAANLAAVGEKIANTRAHKEQHDGR